MGLGANDGCEELIAVKPADASTRSHPDDAVPIALHGDHSSGRQPTGGAMGDPTPILAGPQKRANCVRRAGHPGDGPKADEEYGKN